MRPPPVWKASSQEMLRRDDKQRIQILGSWRVALAAGGRASMTHGKVAQSLEMGIGQRGKALSSEDQPCEELESALAAGLADASVVPGVGQPDQIGRASGRARGCQYVEIEVVAVALKKKKSR